MRFSSAGGRTADEVSHSGLESMLRVLRAATPVVYADDWDNHLSILPDVPRSTKAVQHDAHSLSMRTCPWVIWTSVSDASSFRAAASLATLCTFGPGAVEAH